ncbi:Nucleoside-diphosphate-sugar epimerase [Mariprofundus aestuarium]|uniref:Nucleoside-diphosphate-sugar epimerase n=1 Tax=Mariprofundus aestuarium TaxID=1921086 RepID=A0A2K8KZP8_MARES|nr:SDR family oxidoreductase [Mariprofundus aestuarium]ATX80272.1 Nucleoside-diphosphate-sugar epimerase [Mariprofundus aestuarium]
MKVLVTGSTGFVGSAVVHQLSVASGQSVVAGLRQPTTKLAGHVEQVVMGDLLASTDYGNAFESVDVVIHTAARVHVMSDDSSDPLAEYRKVNVDGTLNLARQAAQAGVSRFIYISSIKVNGESTEDRPFTPDDVISTNDPYGLSKWEAEQGLFALAEVSGMEVVVIRPPLIYGPGVKANFLRMIQWVQKGVPLPLGAVKNRRSLIALDNLVSFIIHCIDHPKASNEVFLISDGEDVSTTDLLKKAARAFGKQARLIPVPVGLMCFVASLLGKKDIADRLFGSLQIDSSKARNLLRWNPVINMDEQLKKTVEGWK